MLSDTDLAWIRDEIGSTPDDDTLYEWFDELGDRTAVALRALKRRRADATAGGQQTRSFSLDGVMSVSLTAADIAALDAQIARLELAQGGAVGRLQRRDRYR